MKGGERVPGRGAAGTKGLGWEGERWEHSGHEMDTAGPQPCPHALGSCSCVICCGSLPFTCDLQRLETLRLYREPATPEFTSSSGARSQ